MSYHVGRAGRALGVYSLEDIRTKLATGELLADDLGWIEGMPAWRTLGEISHAAPSTPPAAPSVGVIDAKKTPEPIKLPAASSRESDESAPATSRMSQASEAKHRGRSRRRIKPANHLVGAILVTLFCCLPIGIAAIVYASQVDGKYNAGDYAGAREAAHKAKNWIWISFGAGLIGGFVYAAFALAGGIMTGY